MGSVPAAKMNELVGAHAALKADDLLRLRSLSMAQRSALLESACEAAAIIQRIRIAAGLPRTEPAPWPASTWEFLKRHAARVRT
ncbi:MAG: hypothetical protein ACLQNE_15560 [Thermoguttaceae bacterium]